MKKFDGFESKYQGGGAGFEPLPKGAYVGKIYGAAVKPTSNGGEVLILQLDVTEGEHEQYFHKRFKADEGNKYGQKYKGILRLFVPKGDGSDSDSWTIRQFNSAFGAIEDSNDGYHWDWNESGLKGLNVGFTVRAKEWEMNDLTGWTTEIFSLAPIADVREGKVRIPKDKPLANRPETAVPAGTVVVEDDDLPF